MFLFSRPPALRGPSQIVLWCQNELKPREIIVKTRNAWLVLVCGLAVGNAAALSLGSAHGRVLLGRPVDLVFEVQLDPGMELESACLAAELVSGESPVGRGQVRLQPLPPARGHASAVRLQTGMLADEPVLTVSLSVGCAGKITRTYVFLADLPESVPPSTAPVAIPWEALPVPAGAPERGIAMAALNEGASASVAPAPAREPAPAASAPARPPQAVAPAPRRDPSSAPAERVAPVRPAQPPAQAASAAASGAAAAAPPRPRPAPRPRLVMEPLAVVMTKATASAPAAAAAAPQVQAAPAGPQPAASAPPAAPPQAPASEAASAPAPAPAQGPEPESLRTLKLQEELARMRMQAASDHAAALALQQRVERIESERFHPGVVYGLLALVGLLLAWMAWQVLRFRTAFERSSLAWSESVAQYGRQKNGSEGD